MGLKYLASVFAPNSGLHFTAEFRELRARPNDRYCEEESSHKAILEGRKSDDDDVASPFTLRAVGTLVRGMISFSDAAPKP